VTTTAGRENWKLEARAVGKAFDNGGNLVEAIHEVTFSLRHNEIAVFLGPSGCGKSSLIRMIGGIERPTKGELLLDGRAISGPGPDRGIVFQAYASFPWLTVERNINFGLKALRVPLSERCERVRTWIETVGLTGFENAYPSALSGGMRQRLALARTLATHPDILLLDEPFAALDAQTRGEMQQLLLEIWGTYRTTVVFVTHDLREALYLADRVFLMSPRPSTIRDVVEVTLPRPRPREVMLSREFICLEERLFAILRSGASRANRFQTF
jgi:NitT/TauT family transport system ATP-binding protein